MQYFKDYCSNTLAGTGNQFFFLTENESEIYTGRLFYRIFQGGCYPYSLLFSNIIDSTYADGSVSHKNLICDSWHIEKASVGICKDCNCDIMVPVGHFHPLTFGGKTNKEVMPGEFFSSDPVELEAASGDYLCLEISFRGRMIPYHEETLIPTFLLRDGKWIPSKHMPFPSMIGCQKKNALRIAFLGDSITQGIGVEANSYTHWNALLADKLGAKYSYWNLGLGCGRADDAASDGAWLFKAKQADVVILCFGVNDMGHGFTALQIEKNLSFIVQQLSASGVRVVVQTIPPFDYSGDTIGLWEHVNAYIKGTLSNYCDLVFDVVPVLAKSPSCPHMAKYGGHPNAEGCAAWANALYPVLKEYLEHIDS